MRKKRILSVILLLAACIFSGAVVQAEEPDLYIEGNIQKLFTSDGGLLSTPTQAIAQTPDGFIWIGGYGGLVRYDGVHMVASGAAGPAEFCGVSDLMCAADGSLWLASQDGGVFVLKDGEMVGVPAAGEEETLEASCLAQAPSGDVYIGTQSGIWRTGEDGMCVRVSLEPLEGEYIQHMLCTFEEELLITTRSGKLYCCSGQDCRRIELGDYSDKAKSLAYDEATGCYLIGTKADVIVRCSRDFSMRSEMTVPGMKNINAILSTPEQVLWVCADNGIGFFRDGRFRQEKLLLDNSVDRMLIDLQGNLWFSSSRQGVLCVSPGRFVNINQVAGLDSVIVNAVEVQDGLLYAGHDDGLLVLDAQTFEPVESPACGRLEGVRIRSIYADSEGNLWIATTGEGLLMRSPEGEWIDYTAAGFPGIPSDNTRCICPYQDGLIIGTDAGAYVVRDGKVENLFRDPEDCTCRILGICASGDEVLLGTDGYGLWVTKNGKVTRIITKEDGLKSNVIMKIRPAQKEKGFWLVTGNNLALFDPEDGLRNVEHFPNWNILDLIPMEDGNVLIPTGRGIYEMQETELLSEAERKYRLYLRSDGLPYEVTANSVPCVYQDQLFLCGAGGIIGMSREEPEAEDAPCQLVIDRIETDAGTFYVQDQDHADIAADVQRIGIRAHAMTYRGDNPEVCYQLQGFDMQPQKIRAKELGTISYTNLPGGSYTFRMWIESPDSGQVQEKLLAITKAEKWYENAAVRAGIVALCFTLFIFLLNWLANVRTALSRQKLTREFEESEKQHLQEIAFKDYLTGLYNRNYLNEWMREIYPGAKDPITFISVDCNNLKMINDTYGHEYGDQLLILTAELLSEGFRQGKDSDTILRMGGDEFLVLCCGMDEETARRRMEQLRENASKLEIKGVPVSFGYGICTQTRDSFDFEEGLRVSDLEMLKEKDKFHGRKG